MAALGVRAGQRSLNAGPRRCRATRSSPRFRTTPRRSRKDWCSRDGELYESTGLQGESTLRRVDITTGKTLQRLDVPAEYFAEGLALVGDELLQLTWQHHLGFVYDRKTFKQKRTFPYKTEGWGIAYDGASRLVMSDGSDTLTFLDPKTLAVTKTLRVQDAGRPVGNLNELEWIEGEIWANVWMTDRIARISPNTGEVNAWIDLASLWPVAAAAVAERAGAERHRLRQGHPPDFHHRQEVAAVVSDFCRGGTLVPSASLILIRVASVTR